MRNWSRKAVSRVVVALLATGGCTGNSAPLHPDKPAKFERGGVASGLVANSGVVENLRGDLVIMPAPNGQDIFVVLDRGAREKTDGVADLAFGLQRDATGDGIAPLVLNPIRLEDASLRYDGRTLEIEHPQLSVLLFVRDGLAHLSRGPSAGPGRRTWGGFGLSRAIGTWPMAGPGLAEAAAKGFTCGTRDSERAGAMNLPPGGTCDSGGEGSSSCSVSSAGFSCSVSCGSGYYACCNAPGGCKCIKP